MEGGNPYARMVGVIRGETQEQTAAGETDRAGMGAGPAKLRLGKVTARKPLEVTVAGIPMPASCFRLNERLTRGAKWKVQLRAPVRVSEEEPQSPGDEGEPPAMVQTHVTGPIQGPVSCPGGHGAPQLAQMTDGTLTSEKAELYGVEAEQLEIDLEVGDEVLMLTEDDQSFFILCKVVSAA